MNRTVFGRWISDKAFELVFWVIILSLLIVFANGMAAWRCHATWKGSGMTPTWEIPGGCMLTLPDGRRIPADHYREQP